MGKNSTEKNVTLQIALTRANCAIEFPFTRERCYPNFQGFGAGAALRRSICLQPERSLWPGSGTSLNISGSLKIRKLLIFFYLKLKVEKNKIYGICKCLKIRSYFRQIKQSFQNVCFTKLGTVMSSGAGAGSEKRRSYPK